MNDIYSTAIHYVCISPKMGDFNCFTLNSSAESYDRLTITIYSFHSTILNWTGVGKKERLLK